MMDADEWTEWGGVRILAVDETDGGAPIGLTEDELRRSFAQEARGAGWARARAVLEDLFRAETGPTVDIDIGYVRYLGGGLSRHAYGAQVDVIPDRRALSGTFVVLLPVTAAASRTLAREHHLLVQLHRRALPFRIPAPMALVDYLDEGALVQGWLRGVELDLRAGRQPLRPWDIVGAVAAALHAIPAAELAVALPGHATRRDHALAALRVLDDIDDDSARAASSWATARLPPAEPASLLHGDLRGPNILIDPGGPPGVVDWADACGGDPAYDLAVVTRAARRPFQIAGGLDRLLAAYCAAGRSPSVTRDHVRIHELGLLAGWVVDAHAGRGAHPVAAALDQLRGFVRRL
jgi:aminoglycoside phosphotransferase (APT) family kinase protein